MAALISTRRKLLTSAAVLAATSALPACAHTTSATGASAGAKYQPFPLTAVRLLDSDFGRAVEVNRAYLRSLDADRLMCNFRKYAGLEPKGESYGGWELDTISGHSLGHYLTAISLMHAQTGDAELRARANYIVAELATCQAAHGDGYVAGFSRRRGETIENGKLLFPELMAGDIRSQGFDLNGCWVPFYNWHKLFDGLFHAQTYCENDAALEVAIALGSYIDGVFAQVSDDEVQTILDCEHGGINESFAELYERTGDLKWLTLARRLRHSKILDPLARGESSLPFVHANTQIPKVIGLGRIYEVAGDADDAAAARFFWDTVINDHTYVIGGNADREYFQRPNSISRHITEQTCESCNTYNMLKLTRQLFGWSPQSHLFDYYERAHLNHIMAQHDPETGMFAYMVPLMSGEARQYSTPHDSFWCCVGTGMESHAKHGDSIYWRSDDTLLVNLYIPSQLTWAERGAQLTLETNYPFSDTIELGVDEIGPLDQFAIALRIPSWTGSHAISVNGAPVAARLTDGYVRIERRWAAGDKIRLTLPLPLRIEATEDDPHVVALLRGPLVLAADMGPAPPPPAFDDAPAVASPILEQPPALVGEDILAALAPLDEIAATYRADTVMLPDALTLAPFYRLTHRRTAVYFNTYSPASWEAAQAALATQRAANNALRARTVDVMHLGEMQSERDHELDSNISYPTTYRGQHGRDARSDGYFSFWMDVRPGPLTLRARYWGDERSKDFEILVDGEAIARQTLDAESPGEFLTIEYPIPERLTQGKSRVRVRFQPSHDMTRCGPVYGVWLLSSQS